MFNLTKEQIGFFKPDMFEYVLVYEDKIITGETLKNGDKSEMIFDDRGNVAHKVSDGGYSFKKYLLFGRR